MKLPEADARTSSTFSVLVATYNQSAYILESLQSVADQTCHDYELVIVNDGSTDDTEKRVAGWISGFQRRYPRTVRFSTIPNSGQSAALEHGFSLCTGNYVCLLDSDDRWLPSKLERMAELVSRNPDAGMLVHPLYVIGPDGWRTGDMRPKRARLSAGDLREGMRQGIRHVAPPTSGVSIRYDIFRQLVPMPTKRFTYGADTYLTYGASLLSSVVATEEALGEYRLNPTGQYLQRMLSPEGLVQSVAHVRVIAKHFGLEHRVEEDSWAARSVFAVAKLREGFAGQITAFFRLIRATAADPSFGLGAKLAFISFWSLCLLSPRAAFSGLWRIFQLKHTGYDKVMSRRSPADAT